MNNFQKTFRATALTLVLVAGLSVQATAETTTQDFESGSAGWTQYNDVVDLGETELAGCTTIDTSDYDSLRLYAIEDSWAVGLASTRQDNDFLDYSMIDHRGEDDTITFQASIYDNAGDGLGLEVPIDQNDPFSDPTYVSSTNQTKFMELSSYMYLDPEYEPEPDYFPGSGFVIHGPAVWSPAVELSAGSFVKFDWAASGADDDYKAFGYIVNVDTCEQQELLDATGFGSQWQTVEVEVEESGEYSFVFIAGTFDQSFGGAAGGNLYIDNIVMGASGEPQPVPYAGPVVTNDPETAGSGSTVTYLGSDLDSVISATIGGQSATVISKSDATLTLRVPTGLAQGMHDVVLKYSTTEHITLQNGFILQDAMKVWTKLQADNTVKMYAKNIIGEGKIQFFHNGKEIAWVRAADALNPKLREANGAYYLVRTVELVAGKNAFEIHLDGTRIWRAAYSK